MPIPLPHLDDRSFTDLVDEAKRLIPGLAPSWTDHNGSDPGITLVELFAFVTEMLLYRADRVTAANKRGFVQLLRGPAWSPTLPMEEEIRLAIKELREEPRAVTVNDFKRLAETVIGVARAYCLPNRNVEVRTATGAPQEAPAHVSVLVVPSRARQNPCARVARDLATRCLLTTRLHVALPRTLPFSVNIIVHIFADQDETTITAAIMNVLDAHYHPIHGGAEGQGWPLGQALYISDLYALLDTVTGVDYVKRNNALSEFAAAPERRIIIDGECIGLRLEEDELPAFDQGQTTIEVIRQTTLIPEE